MDVATEARKRKAALYHGPGFPVDRIAEVLAEEGVAVYEVVGPRLAELDPDTPAILILDRTVASAIGERDGLAALPDRLSIVCMDPDCAALAGRAGRSAVILPESIEIGATLGVLRSALGHSAARIAAERNRKELERTRSELRELNRIGMALMTERDPDALLVQILEQARRLTDSDAGSLYLVEQDEENRPQLRFRLARNDSVPDLPLMEFTLPLDHSSLAGYVASTGQPLVLDDAYEIPADAPYSQNRSFDERFGYRTKSLLVVPMADHKGEVVGVLQLINRKSDPDARIVDDNAATASVLPYGDHEVQLVRSLAGQAAVSIENSRLYHQIEHIFESFVKAAVAAIDQRDPTTAGHSVRVATLTCDMAEHLPRAGRGRWASARLTREQLRELRYAALLHDFGKVGVREHVLVKAKKLPAHLFERLEARFGLIYRTLEAEHHRRRADYLLEHGREAYTDVQDRLREELEREVRELDDFQQAVRQANEPAILPEERAAVLDEIAQRTFRDLDGNDAPYLTAEELHFLSIPKGSLNEEERREIESHVQQTYNFLTQIPWTDDLSSVAEIAYGHHEKLDGRGYPRGIMGDDIPVQTRIMTIADIFDALTASDRPYKRALAAERALDILNAEAESGMLDRDLVAMLIESESYLKVLERDWREL